MKSTETTTSETKKAKGAKAPAPIPVDETTEETMKRIGVVPIEPPVHMPGHTEPGLEAPAPPQPTEKGHEHPRQVAEELCTFAFRLTPAERDIIHKAAGPGKASRFVKAVVLSAAGGDLETIKTIVERGVGA